MSVEKRVLGGMSAALVDQLREVIDDDAQLATVDAVERLLRALLPFPTAVAVKLPPVRGAAAISDAEARTKYIGMQSAMTAPTQAQRQARRGSIDLASVAKLEVMNNAGTVTMSPSPGGSSIASATLGIEENIPVMRVIPTPGVKQDGGGDGGAGLGDVREEEKSGATPEGGSGVTTPWRDMAPTPAEFTPEGLEMAKAAMFKPKLPPIDQSEFTRGTSRVASRKEVAPAPKEMPVIFKAPLSPKSSMGRRAHASVSRPMPEKPRGFCFAVVALCGAMLYHLLEALWHRLVTGVRFFLPQALLSREEKAGTLLHKRRQTAALALMGHDRKPSTGVFLPASRFVRVWEYGILCAILFVVVTAPLRLGFELWGDSWFPFDVVVDAMFALDILISMNTAFQDPDNDKMVGQRSAIVKQYLSGGSFVIDFISAFPVWLVANSNYAKILLLLKPLRLTRVSFITSRSSRLGSSTRLRQVFNIGTFVFIIHCISCSYWFIANLGDRDASSEWAPEDSWPELYEKYADALHWTLKSTLKSGPQPETYGQYVFTCAVILIGEVLKAYLIGSITEILTTLNLAQAEKKAQLDNVTTFLSRRRVDADLRKRILEFFDYRWSVGYSVKEHDQLLGQLPAQLSLELSLELKRTLIDKVPMFDDLPPEVVVMLAEALKPMLAVPDELIVVQGVVGTGMYYVNRGVVRVEFNPPREADDNDDSDEDGDPADLPPPIEVMTTSIGSSFGEDSLVTRKARIATVRALTFCDLQRLSYRNYKRVCEICTQFKRAVDRAAKEKAAIVRALSRSKGMLKKLGSDRALTMSRGHSERSQIAQTPGKTGRFTRIAAEAMATSAVVRSPESSHRELLKKSANSGQMELAGRPSGS